MHGVLFADMFDAEIVNHESEVNRTGVMAPEGRHAWGGAAAMLRKMLGEMVVGNAARLIQSWDSFSDFHVDPAIGSGK
jgi:hypothetical protein